MDAFLAICAFLCSLAGIVGAVVPIIPGSLLSYVGLLCAYAASYSQLSATTMWLWLGITLAVIVLDFFLPAWITRRLGGSRAGAVGATVGIFVGLFLFPPFGILLGPYFGAVLGELTQDKSNPERAFLVGLGSFVSFLVGTGLKIFTSLIMLFYVIGDCWGPLKETISRWI